MKRILVNATHKEEQRIAVLQDSWLYDVDIETSTTVQTKSNIHLGRVTRLEPSLDAAFVDYGAERNGFLPFKEIHRDFAVGDKPVKEGQQLLVQVEKSERGTKGAALSTRIAMAGRYLVFMPNTDTSGGISRRIDDEERRQMRDILNDLPLEPGSSAIIRTAGVGRNKADIQADLDFLQSLWKKILAAGNLHRAPQLIYSDNNLITRLVRDYLQDDVDEIIIDDESLYNECVTFIRHLSPSRRKNVVFYDDEVLPLFNRFQLEGQLETIFQREVTLPSGGAIIIDQTEALVSIDVNSSRSNRGGDIEETALHTNLEAADEIARQLRLRDIGGLVVIDFIDMSPAKNIRETEQRLRTAMQNDRARVQLGRISRFGLLELSRQRLRSSLLETSTVQCPKCNGNGVVRTTESASLAILRLIEQQACMEHTLQVRARLPLPIATFLLNEKRSEFNQIEIAMGTNILILPSTDMTVPSYELTRIDKDGKPQVMSMQSDLDNVSRETEQQLQRKIMQRMKPVVESITPERANLVQRFVRKITRNTKLSDAPEPPKKQQQKRPAGNKAQQQRGGNRNNRGGRRRAGQRNRQRQAANTAA